MNIIGDDLGWPWKGIWTLVNFPRSNLSYIPSEVSDNNQKNVHMHELLPVAHAYENTEN